MTAIFTDNYAYSVANIEIGDYELREKGRELIFSTENESEFRLRLSDEQFNELADILLLNGYRQEEGI